MKNLAQMITLKTEVPEHLAGKRLDQVAAQLFADYSRARLQEWIRTGCMQVNGQHKRPRDLVHTGQIILLQAEQPVPDKQWQAQPIALDIIYEDEALIVINKPVGLVVHPAAGNPDNTLSNALLYHCPALAQIPRAGIVHRLDKDTSGLLVIAKTLPAHTELVRQLQAHTVQREYETIVTGLLIAGRTIDTAMGRHPVQRKKRAVLEFGKPAITHYRVVERFRAHTRLRVTLETGRTHQIRVHMAHIHHPIVGDKTYGGRLQLPRHASAELIKALREFNHQALHAQRLSLIHPIRREPIEWTSSVPADMQNLLQVLRQDNKQDDDDF
jgi:23S rRNA pseudouridine1911/1915/1917 synthase